MLDDKAIREIKRQVGLKMILELGLAMWYSDEYLFGDTTEILSNMVHDETMDYLVRHTGSVRIYGDALLDQEWEMTRTMISDLQTVARLYFEGKIKMETILR